MEARFRRSERDPERDGDLRQWQVEIVMKDDQSPRLRLQAAEAAFELVAVDHRRVGVMAGREIDAGDVHVEAVPPQPAGLVDAGAVEQAVEPGVESRRAAKGREIAPGSDERLLDGVLGPVGVAEDEPRGGIQAEDRGSCEQGKGVMIASPRSIHEILLHVAPWRRRDSDGRAQ